MNGRPRPGADRGGASDSARPGEDCGGASDSARPGADRGDPRTPARLGVPRLHLRSTDSTNDRARALAMAGAPHGTLVTAAEQLAGRGRQGRAWTAPAGRALLASLVLREIPPLLALASALAVADVVGEKARIKWPNDVLVGGRKVAGILAEGRPQEGWAVLGVGVNVAVRPDDLPPSLAESAAGLGLDRAAIEPFLESMLAALQRRLTEEPAATLDAYRARDALRGNVVRWQHGTGVAAGIDEAGRLLVALADGGTTTLDAGEVHLAAPA